MDMKVFVGPPDVKNPKYTKLIKKLIYKKWSVNSDLNQPDNKQKSKQQTQETFEVLEEFCLRISTGNNNDNIYCF